MGTSNQLAFLEAPFTRSLEFYSQCLAPHFTKRTKLVGISAAIALSVYVFIDRLSKPPKELRHLPYQSYFSFLKSIIYNYAYCDKSEKDYLPIINSPENNGIYVAPNRMGWVVHVANPIDAKYVLMKHESKFPKANIRKGYEETLHARFTGGESLFVLSGARWKSQRALMNPAFRRSMPVHLFGKLTADLFKVIEKSDDESDVRNLMKRYTLDAIGNAGFGFDFKAVSEEDNDWINTYNTIQRGMQDPFYFLLPIFDTRLRWLFPKRQAIHKQVDRFSGMLDQVIIAKRERFANGAHANEDSLEDSEKDLLTLMMETEDKEEGIMSHQELKSNLALFFLAGHDTTANSLASSIYYLAKNPEIQQKAREEAISILGNSDEDVLPSIDQVKNMTYINQIIKETLRLNGPASETTPRLATDDVYLSGTFIPKGARVAVDIYNMHHSNKVWTDPFKFDPDRFKEGGEASKLEAFSWVPFSSGQRQCIGMNFSMNEQRVLLSMFLRKYTWSLPEDYNLVIRGVEIMGPVDLKVKFIKLY